MVLKRYAISATLLGALICSTCYAPNAFAAVGDGTPQTVCPELANGSSTSEESRSRFQSEHSVPDSERSRGLVPLDVTHLDPTTSSDGSVNDEDLLTLLDENILTPGQIVAAQMLGGWDDAPGSTEDFLDEELLTPGQIVAAQILDEWSGDRRKEIERDPMTDFVLAAGESARHARHSVSRPNHRWDPYESSSIARGTTGSKALSKSLLDISLGKVLEDIVHAARASGELSPTGEGVERTARIRRIFDTAHKGISGREALVAVAAELAREPHGVEILDSIFLSLERAGIAHNNPALSAASSAHLDALILLVREDTHK